MRYGKIIICLFTVLFLAVAVFAGQQEPEGAYPFSVMLLSESEAEEIRCWENDSGEYFVFLPGYADLSQAQIRTSKNAAVYIGSQLLTDGMSCDAFQLDKPYDLSCTTGGETLHFRITFVKSANMPAVYIDVPSGSMDYIHAKKGNEEAGTIRLYSADGAQDYAGNLEFIKGRGNATWVRSKRPYSLKLSAEADLLGMGQAQKWILNANALDASHLRNKIVFDFAQAAGLNASPDSKWVDLYLNGEYAGLYLLSERNEIHPQRIDISQQDSFLVSMEIMSRLEEQGYPYVATASGVPLRVHSSTVDFNTMTQIWQSAENAILAEDGIDPVSGKHFTELIDLDSWAKKYLIEEIFGNLDAGAVSQFFYYSTSGGTGKLYAGPVWDYDLTMGNSAEWQIKEPNTFLANRPHIWHEWDSPWFHALYQKDEFYNRVVELYQTVFQPLLTNLLEEGIGQYAAQVSQAAAMNQIRWHAADVRTETEGLRSYMTKRMAFLSSVWLEKETYCLVQVNGGGVLACYAVRPGECLPELPTYEDSEDTTYLGWYTSDTDEPFDITQPIYEDAEIYMKQTAGE